MRITSVTTAVVEANFDYTFVRVETDDGSFGTGEAFFAPGITALVRDLGQVLVGHDPRRIRPLWERLVAAAGGTVSAGVAFNAISGIEAALWDLNGKLADRPISALLGGAHREVVDVYVDLHGGAQLQSLDRVMRYRTPFWVSADGATQTRGSFWEASDSEAESLDGMLSRSEDALAAGFRNVKFDLDIFTEDRETTDRTIGRAELERIAEWTARLRVALGDDVGIAFDCHWRFDVPSATAIAEAVSDVKPMWLEDPVPPDPRALATVSARSAVPVATGENVYLLDGFMALVERGSAHILTPDAQKTGGLAELLLIADVAARHFLPIAPHCIASPLGFLACAHVMSVCSNALLLEFHGFDVPFWEDLVVSERPIIEDGKCRVPVGAGVGVELNLDTVRAYSARGEPVFAEPPVR